MDFPSQRACPDALTLCSQAEQQRLWLADHNQIPLQVIQPACCQRFGAGREAACQNHLLQNCILPYNLVILMLTNVFLIFNFYCLGLPHQCSKLRAASDWRARSPFTELNTESPAAFAVVTTSTRTAVKDSGCHLHQWLRVALVLLCTARWSSWSWAWQLLP